MKSIFLTALFALLFVGLGIGAGFVVGVKSGQPKDAGAAAAAGPVAFAPRTLANLGVEVGRAELGSYVTHREIQAVIQDAPLNRRMVTTPLAGVVRTLAVAPGAVAARGQALVTVLRDAIPPPALHLTGEMFRPINESLHGAFAALRTATRRLLIAETEFERIRDLNAVAANGGAPLVARQTEIELGYQRDQARQAVDNARSELEHHGLSAAEIDAVVKGGHPPRGRELWQRLLQVHGLWPDTVQTLFAALPARLREDSWSIAVLGEMVAAGVVTAELAAAVKATPALREHFLPVAGLLLRGETLARVQWLAARGALADTFDVRAPGSSPDWDVLEVLVRPGQLVAAGSPVAVVHDPREVWLRMQPLGDEVPIVAEVIRSGQKLSARPLLAGHGPELADLGVFRLAREPGAAGAAAAGAAGAAGAGAGAGAGGGAGGDVAFLRCPNGPLPDAGSGSRSWRLRPGLRYLVRVPGRRFESQFVLPKDAVPKQGPDRVVYIQDGAGFRPQTVRVLFEDDTTVVVANDGALFPGDGLVTRGGYVISVALQQGGGGSHGHDH